MASPFHQYLGTESINIYFCTVLRLEYVAEVGYIFSGFMVQGGRLMVVWCLETVGCPVVSRLLFDITT